MHSADTGNFSIVSLWLVTFILSVSVLAPAQAADPSVETLVDEIKAQIDKGEKQRLADPWFLRDLRQIIAKYDYPWRNPILLEDFDSKGPKPPAPWKVIAGEFLVDWRHGLRSVVETPAAVSSSSETQNEDLATALVGALLQQARGKKSADSKPASEPKTDSGYAQVNAPVAITNAFAMELELTARSVTGVNNSRLEIGPYTDETSGAGYRVVYHGNALSGSTSLELIRRSTAGGSSVLEPYNQPLQLEDGQTHRLQWTRDEGGNMVVAMDGNEVLRVTDRGVRDSFKGLAIVNQAGDFAFRKVKIDGQ